MSKKFEFGLPSYDSLFSTEEERQDERLEKVITLPINNIKDFHENKINIFVFSRNTFRIRMTNVIDVFYIRI